MLNRVREVEEKREKKKATEEMEYGFLVINRLLWNIHNNKKLYLDKRSKNRIDDRSSMIAYKNPAALFSQSYNIYTIELNKDFVSAFKKNIVKIVKRGCCLFVFFQKRRILSDVSGTWYYKIHTSQ